MPFAISHNGGIKGVDMMSEPTRDEIRIWKTRLEDRAFRRSHLEFQTSVYRVFEELRRQTGLQRIRAVIARDDIKLLQSVVEKIRKKRSENIDKDDSGSSDDIDPQPYNFDDLEDLIGVKILCPYQTDADEVAKFLFERVGTLRTVENSPICGLRSDPGGYRGYNFTVYPSPGSRHDWTSLRCEIQIKTMLQEAWDAMTHDLVYKRSRSIPPQLSKQFAIVSQGLDSWEASAGVLKDSVSELWRQADDHRQVAVLVMMNDAVESLNKLRKINPDIREILMADLGKNTLFSYDEISQINETIRDEADDGGITYELCYVAALTAICYESPAQTDFAVQLIDRYAMEQGNSADAETRRADVYWALGRFTEAVEAIESARSLEDGDNQFIDSHFCYYVADAHVSLSFVPTETLKQAITIADRFAKNPNNPGDLDTAGFVKIALGENDAEVRAGIEMVNKDLENALATGDERTKQLATAFSKRHTALGDMRLRGELGWWM